MFQKFKDMTRGKIVKIRFFLLKYSAELYLLMKIVCCFHQMRYSHGDSKSINRICVVVFLLIHRIQLALEFTHLVLMKQASVLSYQYMWELSVFR